MVFHIREQDWVVLAPDEAQTQIEANPFHLVENRISFGSLDSQTVWQPLLNINSDTN